MLRSFQVLAAVAAMVSSLSSASATVAVALPLQRLITDSQTIIHGEVLQRESFWDVLKQRIYTHTRLRVLRALKAPGADKEILIRQWGGQVGNVAMKVEGNADLRVGEEVVLFLTRDAQYHYVVGLAQGKYSVSAGADGRKLLNRDLSGLAFASWDRRGKMTIGKRWNIEQPLTLDDLVIAIKATVSNR